MYHLKLCRGLSYSNGKVTATRQRPDVYVEDKATADAAVASGYFRLVEVVEAPDFPPAGEIVGHLDPAQLSKMKVEELKRLAADVGIDVSGLNKAEIVKALAAEEVAVDKERTISMEELAEMSEEELRSLAAEADISLDGCVTKEDILAAISVANGGSYTMIDLQRE